MRKDILHQEKNRSLIGKDSLRLDEAGDDAAACAVGAGIQVSDECAEPAGVAGYRVTEIQDRDFRERLFLAWSQRLQELHRAEDEHGVLGGEGCTEPGAGPGGLEDAGGEGLERGHSLGM